MNRSNRFWKSIHQAGFTPEHIRPEDDRSILKYGFGLTSVVGRATARADQLSAHEVEAAVVGFEKKIARYQPRCVAFLGMAAYAILSSRSDIAWGIQSAAFGSGRIWVLPNPSGLNRSFL